ncbi:Flp pilus assembly complex ATPase component TadA [Savagea sp. SN6]|uniref:Flp pilus assembly complex ATPase component TadA n=1 Tax=Savagea serpentis TaxID=2785297 RepID=A0A8J7G9T8_9BACL|nr:ATPase, T2SS/T4P/T4SS family [Savagea serpentis]MBF4500834.1 Flp pilus assembly complex ATPase component TadA [Savagea serpentis]
MKPNERKKLGDLLVEAKIISEATLQTALQQKDRDEKLGDYLVHHGYITEQQLIEVLEYQLRIPHVNLNQLVIEDHVLKLVPKELAKRAQLIPLQRKEDQLYIAMADPMDYFAIEELRLATGCQIETSIASKSDIVRAITKYYDLQESMSEAIEGLLPEQKEEEQNELMNEDSPIVKLVSQIIASAVAQRASDIHIDPQETEVRVRFRIDGSLKEERILPKTMQNMITARIKVMGRLNITERRIPQDGRIKVMQDFKPIDLRLSTLPTVYGEKIVMRVLDLSNSIGAIETLDFSQQNLENFHRLLQQPNGIVLITGPTGSGKSSTLYAGLNHLNSEGVNIITVEDPVEYQLEGINQIQVREEVGLTFAAGLRSILRQDPDVIMIGEIRDEETAQIAIRSSLTGHLVFSTLHTNSAVESISRLVDMGIQPYLIAPSVIGILAQRLVRRVCRDCGTYLAPDAFESRIFSQFGLEAEKLYKGVGCPACNETGYKGRMAVHELLMIDERLKGQIMDGRPMQEMIDGAKEQGFQTLMEDGLQKVLQGKTTVEEVIKIATQ